MSLPDLSDWAVPGAILAVRATPGARRNAVEAGDPIRIWVTARADKGRGKRISVDFFALENDNEPAIIAAQSQRGLQVSDTSDAICWSTSAPIADPRRKPSAMRVKVTNFDTGEFTEVDLTPLERAGRRRRHRR